MTRWLWTIVALLAVPAQGQAADAGGHFAVKGAGLASCDAYVRAREEKARTYFLFGGWLDGYMTGLNQFSPDTYDITAWESTELLAALIDTHCRKNRDDNFFQVVNAMADILKEDRLRERSPRISAKVEGRTALIYRDTMRRIQRTLARHGHYQGPQDGAFDEATRRALEAFQRAEGLKVSGFPDQVTLLKLLRP